MTHDITEMQNRIAKIVEALVKECDFDDFINYEVGFTEWYYGCESSIPSWIGVTCGSYRAVFWDKTNPKYVFKIDLNMEFENWYYEEDENEEDKLTEPCLQEYMVYLRAVEEGLDEFFAWIMPVYDYKGRTFYAMEYCEVDDYGLAHEVATYKRKSGLGGQRQIYITTGLCEYEDAIFDYAADECWGYANTQHVRDFLNGMNIHDCHSGNWGWTKEGHLVIIDYAGIYRATYKCA